MRKSIFERKTGETEVKIEINLDEKSESAINTGIGFFDHMLNLFAFRAGITLNVECVGDLEVDGHHTVEDIGISLGQAILIALSDKSGINRYGVASIPMDETLASCVIDISGRPFLVFNADLPAEQLGDFETELTEEFFRAVAFNAEMTLHLNILYGNNTHHMIEALFKAFGYAFRQAINITGEGIQSTKGNVVIQ
jgi:imidazoleglycerol-phosphate dehydratase